VPGTPASAVDGTDDIGEDIAWAVRQRRVCTLLGSVPDELRHRLALDRGGSLNLLVEIGIEAQASNTPTVSQWVTPVIHSPPGAGRGERS